MCHHGIMYMSAIPANKHIILQLARADFFSRSHQMQGGEMRAEGGGVFGAPTHMA